MFAHWAVNTKFREDFSFKKMFSLMRLLSNDRLDWGMEVTTVRFCFTLFKVNDMKCYAREGCTTDGLITIIETETINDIVQSILP